MDLKEKNRHLVTGILSMTAKGFGFVVPDVRETEDETDVFVPAVNLGTAMHGDHVVAEVTLPSEDGRSREGEIVRILERANEKIVGTFESSKSFGFVTPDNTKLNQDIFVAKKFFNGAKTGSKVVVKITKWPDNRRKAEGEIVEVLGKVGAPGVDVLAVMRQYELDENFPEDVQSEAEATETSPSSSEYSGRKDRRDLQVVTVDGEDSKDLDDGVYARQNADGSFFLGVYIADVSYYVRENQPLDREAYKRGTSVYLVDRVIPMLPKELSNGICSLNAGVDRLSMACEMNISPEGEVTSYEILPTVIHVYRRLTYNIVNKVLVERAEPFLSDNQDILKMLEDLAKLREVLKNKRCKRGSIDFEIPEVKVKLDEKGRPVALIKREGSLAESIIEECMLAANETVARHMDIKNLPFMYRVHEQPTEEKIERLNNILAAFGAFVHPDENGHIKPMDVQKVLNGVAGKPEERLISTVALRSMQQARYSEQSLGHFGLAARYYTHFTSPIRRYPDLIVHRLLRETFATGSIPSERQQKLRAILPEIAEQASNRERVAIEAERETTDMKKIEYMAQFIGEEFKGVISGVTAFGIFVELDNGVEGLVHVSTMKNDYYEYIEEQFAMVGERSHLSYRLGDEIEVILIRANIPERTLDFVIKGNGDYDLTILTKSSQPNTDSSKSDKKFNKKGKRAPRKTAARSSDIIAANIYPTDNQPKKSRAPRKKERKEKLTFKEDITNERPAKKEGDYHRVVVTGLNSAVWPDPPGYKPRRERENEPAKELRKNKVKSKRPRFKRKTEGATRNNK